MAEEHENRDEPPETQDENKNPFTVVGIGASAGGLDAFERFFTALPSNTGMAFVVVQHLDPNHESILADLVQRYTDIPVAQATNKIDIEPNHIYIIPPNREMLLTDGQLILNEPTEPRGFRLPIDQFFRSLAEDCGERAVAIVLSGAASDGALGIKSVKGEGGMVMAQEPETARYRGMPQSAISAGVVDFVLPPEDMPASLMAYVNQAILSPANGERVIPLTETDMLAAVFELLRKQTGHNFAMYKRNTLIRRIERRMVVTQRDTLTDYLEHLGQNPVEIETLFRELLIGVTRFFRDEEAFEALQEWVIPQIVEARANEGPIRVWVAGCSTGEEAYSLAILFYDEVKKQGYQSDIQVFATDIDAEAIERARLATYPDNIAADVPPDILRRHFIQENQGYRVKKHIRNIVIMAEQSLIKDPPFSRLDLVSCRNLLIYLGSDLQKQVIQLFHYALQPSGYLFLGTSETLSGYDRLYDTVERKWKIYRKLHGVQPRVNTNFGSGLGGPLSRSYRMPHRSEREMSLEDMARAELLRRYSHPSVIINQQGDVLYFHGETSDYLRPPAGEASFNVLKMVISPLRIPVTSGLRQVNLQSSKTVEEIKQITINEEPRTIRVVVRTIEGYEDTEQLIMIVFEELPESLRVINEGGEQAIHSDLPDVDDKDSHIIKLEQELRNTREYLQTTIEELETSNEELKAANEELQSSNEEFQSTNEELETTKEELQAVNEELVTVNAELKAKIEELETYNNNQKNLLDNMNVGLVFMGINLNIRLFNPIAGDLLNLIESDTGRTVRHFASNFNYDHFVDDCESVLDTLESRIREIRTTDKNQTWYRMQISPYRTLDGDVDGLVVTFANITDQKRVQDRMEVQRLMYNSLVSQLPDTSVFIFDEDMRYLLVGGEAVLDAGFSVDDMLGETLWDVLPDELAEETAVYYRAALDGERIEFLREYDGHTYRNVAAPIREDDDTILAGMVFSTRVDYEEVSGETDEIDESQKSFFSSDSMKDMPPSEPDEDD